MRGTRELWDMMSSYLGRKTEISHKKKDKRTSQSVNGMNKTMNTGQQITEILLRVAFRSYNMTRFS